MRLAIYAPAFVGLLTGCSMLLDIPAAVFASLCLLARLVAARPTTTLLVWGAVYVPLCGIWLVPALDGLVELSIGVLGLVLSGALFYGVPALLLSRLLARLPELIMPLSILMGELAALGCGLVLAPIGLAAVNTPLAPCMRVITVFGVSGLLALLASTLFVRRRRSYLSGFIAAALVMLIPIGSDPRFDGPLPIGISHHPDAKQKWSAGHAKDVLQALMDASAPYVGQGLIVWPENAVTTGFNLDKAASQVQALGAPVLFGMTRFANPGSPELRNSAVLVTPSGMQVSDKRHLAPLIEAGFWPFTRSDMQSGDRRMLVLGDGTRILPLICYEAAFPIDLADFDTPPDLIVVLAAETGFAPRLAGSLMKRHALARQVETGLPVLRVSDVP